MRPTPARLLLLMALLPFVLAGPEAAAGEDASRTLSPYFVVQGADPGTEAFPLKSTQVIVEISGVIADVVVTQTYENQGARPIHARYVFPASTRAAVHGMTMRIGDEVVVARIREREKARAEFETARDEGRSASLLEQHRPNIFTMNVANILPGDRVEVELHYTELLIPGEGIYEFVYPEVVAPRYAGTPEATTMASTTLESAIKALATPESTIRTQATTGSIPHPLLPSGSAPGAAFDIQITLAAGMPLHDVRSPSHAVDVAWDAQDLAKVWLKDRTEPADRDFVLQYRLAGDAIQGGLLMHQGEKENFFLLMVQPPERVRAADVPPREYIFILDVSGSMDGFPLDTAKLLIGDLIGHLRPTDLFNVILFAGGSSIMAPASVPATPENTLLALDAIARRGGGGGTELLPAMEAALRLPRQDRYARTVVILTDGLVAADREVFDIVRRHLHDTNVFSFGIGSSVNRFLIEGIARTGMGEPFVVTQPDEAAEAAARFRAYVESPLLTGVGVAFRGLEVYDVEPPALPDLFARRPLILFGKWRGVPEGGIEVSGQGPGGPWRQMIPVTPEDAAAGGKALPSLWARARLARLSDFSYGRPDAATEREITDIGLGYSLLTKNTSFVAVVEQVRNTTGGAQEVNQPVPLARGVSALAAEGGYASGAEPELWILLGLTIVIVALRQVLR